MPPLADKGQYMLLECRCMNDTSPPSPSLLRHLLAMVYDVLLVVALVFVVYAIALGMQVWLTHGERRVLSPWLGQLLFALSLVGFYSAFWCKSGQTLGMQAWRIRLVRSDGGRVRPGQALLRCVGATLSIACFGLGYLWRLVDRNGRYWHDYLSGTRLELLPRRSRDKRAVPEN